MGFKEVVVTLVVRALDINLNCDDVLINVRVYFSEKRDLIDVGVIASVKFRVVKL